VPDQMPVLADPDRKALESRAEAVRLELETLPVSPASAKCAAKLRAEQLYISQRLAIDDARALRRLLASAGRRAGVKKILGWGRKWRAAAQMWAAAEISGRPLRPPRFVAALPRLGVGGDK
jgi:hypothetical protein